MDEHTINYNRQHLSHALNESDKNRFIITGRLYSNKYMLYIMKDVQGNNIVVDHNDALRLTRIGVIANTVAERISDRTYAIRGLGFDIDNIQTYVLVGVGLTNRKKHDIITSCMFYDTNRNTINARVTNINAIIPYFK